MKPKDITERNKWFESLTRQQKRVQIALDVLEQLEARRLTVDGHQGYLNAPIILGFKGSLQNALQSVEQCGVCAKGAMFLARVEGYNNFEPRKADFFYDDLDLSEQSTIEALSGIFEEKELDLIECAFEGTVMYEWSEEANAAAKKYRGLTYEDRLKAIMQNIVEHNGDFVI